MLARMRVLRHFGIFEMVKTFQYKPMGLKKFGLKFALLRRCILELVERKQTSEK